MCGPIAPMTAIACFGASAAYSGGGAGGAVGDRRCRTDPRRDDLRVHARKVRPHHRRDELRRRDHRPGGPEHRRHRTRPFTLGGRHAVGVEDVFGEEPEIVQRRDERQAGERDQPPDQRATVGVDRVQVDDADSRTVDEADQRVAGGVARRLRQRKETMPGEVLDDVESGAGVPQVVMAVAAAREVADVAVGAAAGGGRQVQHGGREGGRHRGSAGKGTGIAAGIALAPSPGAAALAGQV